MSESVSVQPFNYRTCCLEDLAGWLPACEAFSSADAESLLTSVSGCFRFCEWSDFVSIADAPHIFNPVLPLHAARCPYIVINFNRNPKNVPSIGSPDVQEENPTLNVFGGLQHG